MPKELGCQGVSVGPPRHAGFQSSFLSQPSTQARPLRDVLGGAEAALESCVGLQALAGSGQAGGQWAGQNGLPLWPC